MHLKTILLTTCIIFSSIFTSKAQTFSPGDLAIIGFNSDSTDFLSMVTFVTIPANTTIFIRDDEWNGTAFTTGEGTLSWKSGANEIPAGTVILLNSMSDTTKLNSNFGTLTKSSVTNFNMSGSDEGVFVYIGTNGDKPTTFLTAIFNGSIATAGTTLAGTGLTEGATAIILTSGVDIATYNGVREGKDKNGFLSEIAKISSNWLQQDGTGNQSADGILPDLPFASGAFSVASTDVTPPSVTRAIVQGKTSFKLTVSEKVTKSSAENTANYTFTPTLAVSSAVYDDASMTVTLTTSDMISGTRYKLTAKDLVDEASNNQTQSSQIDHLYFNDYAGGDVVITEIMYNLGSGDSLEFIELYNKSDAPIAIGGLQLGGVIGIVREFSIPSKAAVLIASDSAACARLYKVGPVYDWEGGFLSNSGGYIAIKNSLGVVVDSVAYDDEGYWSTAADGNGASLEIIDVNKDNNDYSNWRASKTPLNVKVGSVDVFCSPSSLPLINPTKEISKEADFIVYPNPVSGNEIYFSRELRGYLADAMGRILKRFDKVTQVDVSGLPTGLYFVATDSGIKKVLIQK